VRHLCVESKQGVPGSVDAFRGVSLTFIVLVHQGRFPVLDASVIASALASYVFVCDPFNAVRSVARWAGNRTDWYSFPTSMRPPMRSWRR
jgi:hypothetical protein